MTTESHFTNGLLFSPDFQVKLIHTQSKQFFLQQNFPCAYFPSLVFTTDLFIDMKYILS